MDFITFIQQEIFNKKKQGKVKTAKNYEATRNTLIAFLEEKNIRPFWKSKISMPP